jgi:TATA-binding protein-associated factor
LQKFKTHIAQTVINEENVSIKSMNTEQLLDLFVYDKSKKETAKEITAVDDLVDITDDKGQKTGLKNVLESLEQLWDESQYKEEYDLNNFIRNINKS